MLFINIKFIKYLPAVHAGLLDRKRLSLALPVVESKVDWVCGVLYVILVADTLTDNLLTVRTVVPFLILQPRTLFSQYFKIKEVRGKEKNKKKLVGDYISTMKTTLFPNFSLYKCLCNSTVRNVVRNQNNLSRKSSILK